MVLLSTQSQRSSSDALFSSACSSTKTSLVLSNWFLESGFVRSKATDDKVKFTYVPVFFSCSRENWYLRIFVKLSYTNTYLFDIMLMFFWLMLMFYYIFYSIFVCLFFPLWSGLVYQGVMLFVRHLASIPRQSVYL